MITSKKLSELGSYPGMHLSRRANIKGRKCPVQNCRSTPLSPLGYLSPSMSISHPVILSPPGLLSPSYKLVFFRLFLSLNRSNCFYFLSHVLLYIFFIFIMLWLRPYHVEKLVLLLSTKLINVEPSLYLDGPTLGNMRCCKVR